nr:ribonuclease H-like domain-containing protein [Tanacetum cinerariifolium]
MALPEDHLAKFHKMADAKEMREAIKSRFGGNDESKKMQKYLLKQQFEEIHDSGVSHKDANQKFLRSIPSSWSQVPLIMRTKPVLDTLSFNDLYNNLRVFERDVKGTTASSSNIQNVAFVSADNTSSTNDVKTAYSVTSPYINDDDMEEMDLKWQGTLLETAELKGTKIAEEEMLGTMNIRLETMVEDLHTRMIQKLWLPLMERILIEALKEKEDLKTKFENWQNSSKKLSRLLNTQMSANDKFGLRYEDYRYGSILSYENEVLQCVFMNKASDLEDTSCNDRYADGMHAVPPPITGNYMPSGPDVEIDYFKVTYGLKQTSADESDFEPSEYAFCESDSSIETSTS